MLPKNETDAITSAFHSCSLAFQRLDRDSLDDYARDCVVKLERLMDPAGLESPNGYGLWTIKALNWFREAERLDLTRSVDGLATWFERRSWGANP